MPRNWWQECDWPLDVGGTGSTHDMEDRVPAPRLLGLKSVSNKAAWALAKNQPPAERQVGFVHGRARPPR